jgi:hypothetical protein
MSICHRFARVCLSFGRMGHFPIGFRPVFSGRNRVREAVGTRAQSLMYALSELRLGRANQFQPSGFRTLADPKRLVG